MADMDQQFRDLADRMAAAKRHTLVWASRPTVPSAEDDAEFHMHLTHAVGSLDRLVSEAEAIRGPLAAELMAHQTDVADALSEAWAEGVGDRAYGFDPDGGVRS